MFLSNGMELHMVDRKRTPKKDIMSWFQSFGLVFAKSLF